MTKDTPILNQINIVAGDFDASLRFYRRLGIDIPSRSSPTDEFRHAQVTLPNGMLLEFDNHGLARVYSAAWRERGGSRALLGFSFASREEVDRVYEDLTTAGYVAKQSPYDAFWGARYAIVADPDGNDVGLMSPVDPDRRTWPPNESPAT
jgi:uncharacterized glyoxalase superfamily protein PhnB